MEILRNCFIVRAAKAAVKLYKGTIEKWAQCSIFVTLSRFFKKHSETSIACKLREKYLSKNPHTEKSSFYALADKCVALFTKIGAKLRPTYENTLQYKAYQGYRGAVARGMANGSLVCMGLWFATLRRICLFAVAFYLPIDWVIRSVLKISFLASVWDELLLLLSFGLGILRFVSGKKEKITRTPLGVPVLLFIAYGVLLMAINGEYPSIAFEGLRATVQYMLFFFAVVSLLDSKEEAKAICIGYCILMGVLGLHGVYQYITAAPIPASWVSQTEVDVRTRVYTIIDSPNIFGAMLIMGITLSGGFFYAAKKPLYKLAALGVAGVCALSILFTFSKGAWVGLVVAAVIFALLCDRRLFPLMLVLLAGALIFVPSIADRITYLFTSDYAEASARGGRSVRWAYGLQLLNRNPAFGLGLGAYGGAVAMNNQIRTYLNYTYLDNYYLKILVEMGITGLTAFIALLYSTLIWCRRAIWRIKDTQDAPIYCGIFSGMVGILVHNFFENIFEVPFMNANFWMFAAILVFVGFAANKEYVKDI